VAKKRSPLLGYNHNVRHHGRVFHVQTEDSGVDHPRVFTHLFHGGVIVATKKVEYDPEADDDVVKGLMQAQHKAQLKDLIHGVVDARIAEMLGPAPALPTQIAAVLEAAAEGQSVPVTITEETSAVHSLPQQVAAAAAAGSAETIAGTWDEEAELAAMLAVRPTRPTRCRPAPRCRPVTRCRPPTLPSSWRSLRRRPSRSCW
jgi:hypothetical protein